MEQEYLKEKANCLRNEMNHLWGAIFITAGGAVGFTIIEHRTILITIYIILGIFLSIIFLND